ncbi:MAG: 1,2-phenylacetyl-CoA epoxidase subunit PaaE [Gammaproteobacteria bacterium]
MSRPSFHALSVADVRREGEDAVSVALTVPAALRAAFRFTAGQYLTVRRPADTSDVRRSYSLCSAPDEDDLRIGVREIPQGALSTWLNRELAPGMTLECMPPDGHFGAPLQAAAGRHLLLIAVGSGITPMLSIAKSALAADPGTRVTLLYGNRRLATTMFREDLEDLKNRYLQRFVVHYVFSRETQEVPLHDGRLNGARIGEFLAYLVPPASVDHAFLCGPAAMLADAEDALRTAGIAADRIHVERFGVAGIPDVVRAEMAAPAGARVTVIVDGVRREIGFAHSTDSILDAARAAGLDLPFSCKSGVCATCRARVLEGEVRMTRNFALMQTDLDAGIVLSCQAHPVTPRVVISFDER